MSLYAAGGKRVVDLLGAAGAIIVLSPLLALIAVIVKMQDGGPAVFCQTRIGRFTQPFTLFKFRSMPVSAPNVPSTAARTLSITPFGKLLRRSNLDELPQLFNVLRGEMSLIGPRPALPSQVELLRLRAGAVMDQRPGLTGLAQVNAFDGMSETEKVDWERKYVARITLLGDVVIVFRTFVYLLRPPPVY
jgi:O-antigen biosynthesis protein WbqP